MGEKLLPDTSAAGRDSVRLQLRELREKWDALDVEIINQGKKLEAFHQLMLLYKDTVQQITSWLDSVEKSLEDEGTINKWTGLSELKNALHRMKVLYFKKYLSEPQFATDECETLGCHYFKTLQQDVGLHKRILDSLKEKALAVMVPGNEATINTEVETLTSRYSAVSQAVMVYLLFNFDSCSQCYF